MNLFEKNYEIINKSKKFHIKEGFCGYSKKYDLIASKEDLPGLIYHDLNGKITIHSSYYPEKESARLIEKFNTEKEVIIVLGIGLGYFLKPLTQKYPKKRIYIIEPDKHLFNLFLHYNDLAEIGVNIEYIIGYDFFDVEQFISYNKENYTFFELKQRLRIHQSYFQATKKTIKKESNYSLTDKWRYKKFDSKNVKIIFIDSAYVLTKECLSAIQQSGNEVKYIHIEKDNYNYDTFIRNFLHEIATFKPDFILTINHLGFDQQGRLTELLTNLEIPYASWYVDSPTVILTSFDKNLSDYCNLFVWDKDYISDLNKAGYEKVDYLPLATMPELFKPLNLKYINDVSFVGSSMVYAIHKNLRSIVFRSDLLKIIEDIALEMLHLDTRRVSEAIASVEKREGKLHFDNYNQMEDFKAAILWRATQIYRLSGIEKLAPFYPTIQGDPNWDSILDNRFKIGREIMYYTEMPTFYNSSKINFNMTSKQMKYAVNQRVFDVAACGQFLLTDYQQQLDEIFDIKTEAVCFDDIEEIPEIITFFLQNDKSRNNYAQAARKKVLKSETYLHRIEKMISIMKQRYCNK